MAKNIIICCDGTSNDFGDRPSNVVKLYSILERVPGSQDVFYDPGVGTPSTYDAFNPLTKKLKYILGLAFGYGLSDNITDAYKFLMQSYQDGDRLYFFGFSRGAYTVRALAGLIDICGLLYANSENLVPEAMRIYAKRKLSEKPKDKSGVICGDSVSEKFKKTFSRDIKIDFLGLWDTVTSVGWVYNPVTRQSTTNNKSVLAIRHAISIDERRAFFRQNLWGSRFENEQDVKQVWFAGVHADVGGSYPVHESGLSNIALEWMLVEAKEKGLLINKAKVKILMPPPGQKQDMSDLFAKNHHQSLKGPWYIAEIWPKIIKKNLLAREQRAAIQEKREVPKSKWVSRLYFNLGRYRVMYEYELYTLHESVLLLLQQNDSYKPKNLMKICGDKKNIEIKFRIEKWVPFN